MAKGRGAEVWDVDGNRFLDFASGIAVCSTGHAHPKVVQAIKDATDDFLHISSDYWHERMTRLGERINSLAPMREPVQVLSLPEWHGVGRGRAETRSLRHRPAPIHRLPRRLPWTLHGLAVVYGQQVHAAGRFLSDHARRDACALSQHLPAAVRGRGPRSGRCSITSRPCSSSAMCRRPRLPPYWSSLSRARAATWCLPDGFLQGLRDLCDRHGILLIFDEVQSGIGRTGRMFASQHWGVSPDIMTLAKGLGSGLPIGLTVACRRHMEKWKRGAHGNTYGGNPITCAAALATLDLVEHEYAANAATVGEYFMGRLRELQNRFGCIGDVRGKGTHDRHGARRGPREPQARQGVG